MAQQEHNGFRSANAYNLAVFVQNTFLANVLLKGMALCVRQGMYRENPIQAADKLKALLVAGNVAPSWRDARLVLDDLAELIRDEVQALMEEEQTSLRASEVREVEEILEHCKVCKGAGSLGTKKNPLACLCCNSTGIQQWQHKA